MRILIADDEPKVRFALRVSLEQHPGFKTIGEAIDAEDLLAQTNVICPDLILLDWDLPGLPAAELLIALRRICPRLRVLVLSEKPEVHQAASRAGASAFVCKGESPDRLRSALDECCIVDI